MTTQASMRPRTTRVYRSWVDRIESGVFTYGDCRQFSLAAARLAMGLDPKGFRTALTEDEALKLLERLVRRGGVLLTKDHAARGEAWLRRHASAPGTKCPFAYHGDSPPKPMPPDLVTLFHHFSYHGGICVDPSSEERSWPVYRVNLADAYRTPHGDIAIAVDYYAPAHRAGLNRGYQGDWWWIYQSDIDNERSGR